MNITSTYQLIDRLYGTFTPIHKQWRDLAPSDSHLWQATQHLDVIKILEADIMDIGRYFLQSDTISSTAEAALLAECIALLRERNEQAVIKLKAEAMLDQILADSHFRTLLSQPFDAVHAPVCWRIAQALTTRALLVPATLDALRQTLTDLAMHFVVRDGNITQSESERLAQFDATFG